METLLQDGLLQLHTACITSPLTWNMEKKGESAREAGKNKGKAVFFCCQSITEVRGYDISRINYLNSTFVASIALYQPSPPPDSARRGPPVLTLNQH